MDNCVSCGKVMGSRQHSLECDGCGGKQDRTCAGMDSRSKRKHRSQRRRLNIESLSKTPADEASSSAQAAEATSTAKENEDKEKAQPGASADTEDQIAAVATSASPRPSGASSPEPNCSICLGNLENKSFTDSCFHTFCFVCLVEWSKVKAECPLCKQSFKSIYHNVTSNHAYDQYCVQTNQRPEDTNPLGHMRHLLDNVRFRYRTTVTDHRYAHIDQEIQNRLLQRPSHRFPIPNWRRPPASSDFRRSVYLQHLQQKEPQMNTRRRVRETSPSFFRENPAQTHRLVPWLNRELNALLHGHGEQIAFVLDLIMDLVKNHAIDSEEFYQHVYPYIGRHTRQFVREFLLFARSPYHMAAYDRHVLYEASQEPHHDSESDSDHTAPGATDDGNNSDVVVVSPAHSQPQPTRGSRGYALAPPRSEPMLDAWERSIMTVGNPSYLGFPPIVRSYGQDNLAQAQDGVANPYYRLELPTSASGWDSPTPGTSSIFDDMMNLRSQNSSQGHLGASGSIWTPSVSSYSAPITPLQPHTDSTINHLDPLNLHTYLMPPSLVHSNSQGDPIVCNESGSDESDGDEVMIVNYEKPWEERSPIQLSSAIENSDSDICITGMSYATDQVKKEHKKKRKHKKREHRDKDKSRPESSRKRSAEDSTGASKTKKRRAVSRSRSRSATRSNREDRTTSKSPSPSPRSHTLGSLSRSRSPIRMRLCKDRDYKHKKFGYSAQGKGDKEDTRQHGHRSHSSTGSRHSYRDRSSSASLSDSDRGSESRQVTYTSTKHRDRGKHASIEILAYRKKSLKHKKNKKHKKDKKKSTTDTCPAHSDEEVVKRVEGKATDSSKAHKHKHLKTKKKKSKHKSHKHKDRNPKESVAENKTFGDISSLEQSVDAESDERGISANVSQQVARMFKELAEIQQQRVRQTQHLTSDSESDSEEDVECVTQNRDCSSPENQSDFQHSDAQGEKESVDATAVSLNSNQSSGDSNKTKESANVEDSNTAVFQTTGLEFVELPSDQTAAFDLELASIAQSLDTTLESEVDDSSRPKQFKKHPFGHKKSGKHSSDPVTTAQGIDLSQRITALSAVQACSAYQKDCGYLEDIQSNDISSCTDFENASQHNSKSDGDFRRLARNYLTNFREKASSIESPTSSAYRSPSKEMKTADKDFVNVETLSDGSDVDIVSETLPVTLLPMPSYRPSKTGLKLNGPLDTVAVPKPAGLVRDIVGECQEEIDVTGVSDVSDASDSDSVVEFVGEEHQKITIATDSSDSDSDSYIEVLQHDSDHYIDVLGNSDDDIVIDADSDSSTEVDYCDAYGKKGVTDKKKSAVDIEPLLTEISDDTELDYSLDELESTQSQGNVPAYLNDTLSDASDSNSEKEFSKKRSDSDSSSTFRKHSVLLRSDKSGQNDSVTTIGGSPGVCRTVEETAGEAGAASPAVSATSSTQEDSSSPPSPAEIGDTSDSGSSKTSDTLTRNSKQMISSQLTEPKSPTLSDDTERSESEEASDSDTDDHQASRKSSSDAAENIEESISNNLDTSTASNRPGENNIVTQATSSSTSSSNGFQLTWTSNPLFDRRDRSQNSCHSNNSESTGPNYISTMMEPGSPLFQPSPEYDQFLPVYDEFSPAASDTTEENFVPED